MKTALKPLRRKLVPVGHPCPTVMAGGLGGGNTSQYRIMAEVANGGTAGSKFGGGHSYVDVSESPMLTVQAGRPVNLLIGGNKSYRRGWKSGDNPAPTIATAPDQQGGTGWVSVVPGGNDASAQPDGKPLYRVPSMAEIAAVPWNGFNVVSTFSGCGGSCLGYRMAGFRVFWANEFIPAAQETYRTNFPDSILDCRDIHQVQPEEILESVGMKAGEIDLLDGSPPCQAFSTAGKREKGWGKARQYENGAAQCNETLFGEFVRILVGLKPKTFVAENVSGLIKGVAKGYFLEILAALKAAGYRVRCQVLDAQWLGVPQMRQRVIFIGVRNDLGLEAAFPKPLPYRYSVREALPWIDNLQMNGHGWFTGLMMKAEERPCPSITGTFGYKYQIEAETDISRYAIGREWDKLKPGEQSERYFQLVRAPLDKPCPTLVKIGATHSAASVCHPTEKRKFSIAELKRICAFPDDFVLTGTYAQQWERLGNAVPPVMMRHIAEAVKNGVLDRIGTEVLAHPGYPCSQREAS